MRAASESDPFRRLVEGEIGVEEYVKSLDERVRERHADEHPPPRPAPARDSGSTHSRR